jgi:putative endonuclease
MKGYLYILKDSCGKFYVGSTTDIPRRMKQHQYGHTQTTTRMDAPKLVLSQEYETLSAARIVERKIKRMKRKDYVAKMVQEGYIRIDTTPSSFNG